MNTSKKSPSGKALVRTPSGLTCPSCNHELSAFRKPVPGRQSKAAPNQCQLQAEREPMQGPVKTLKELNEILKNRFRVFVLFYASWCPFCTAFLPTFQSQVEMNPELFVAVQDDQETLCEPYDIGIFPTVLYFEDGKLVKRLDGVPGVGLNSKSFSTFVTSCI